MHRETTCEYEGTDQGGVVLLQAKELKDASKPLDSGGRGLDQILPSQPR